jgi:hypothetical protein
MNEFEIHMLICKKDLLMGVNCIKSLLRYEEFSNAPIYFHEDGSLRDIDFKVLKSLGGNVSIIEKKEADEQIKPLLSNYPNCYKYRFGEKKDVYLWHKIKTFDYFLLSRNKKVLGLDSDLLFLKKPIEAIEYIKSGTPFYFPDVKSSYSFNEPENEIPVLPSVNTGFIYIPGEEYYSLDSIESALSNLIRNEINYFPAWIEQSAFAHMFYKNGKYVKLNSEKNRIPYFQNVNKRVAECLHFVSYPDVRKLYKSYVDLMQVEKKKLVFERAFEVEFENKKIDLGLKVFENESVLVFEYTWDLEKAKIQALSHCFKILKDGSEEIFDFGSSESGFFIIENNFSCISVYHTYDWYGEKNWSQLEIKL